MIKIEVWFEPNAGDTIRDTLEFDDDVTEKELKDAFNEWKFDQFTSGWRKINHVDL